MSIYYKNIFGEYLFEIKNNKLDLIKKSMFSKDEQIKIQTKGINSIKPKLKGQEPNTSELSLILQYFKKNAKDFRDYNLDNTKKLIKNSVNNDNLITQTVNFIEDLEKMTNHLTKRIREWYGLYAPEISRNIQDNEGFINTILKKDKQTLLKELKITDSMGKELKDDDKKALFSTIKTVQSLFKEKEAKDKYLEKLCKNHIPNVQAITGSSIAAKLLTLAGSLKTLSIKPASTIQLLGAEMALFRHLKTKSNKPPKHGFIITHPLIQSAKKSERGKRARIIADKISIAAKVDFFKGDFIGDKLRYELETKLQ